MPQNTNLEGQETDCFRAHLVIHDGILYARHGSALIAYKIK